MASRPPPYDGAVIYTPGRAWTLGKLASLDGIRGLAIVLVLVGHWGVPGHSAAAAVGVTVFFVLSGFLITSLLVREYREAGTIAMRLFYGRRARRLLPALACVLLVVVTLDLLSGRADLVVERALPALLYAYNWLLSFGMSAVGDPLGHTWSLAIEEQFYLLWPVALIVSLRRGGTRLALRVSVAFLLTSLVDRVVQSLVNPGGVDHIYFATDTNLLSLMTGCSLALAAADGLLPRISGAAALIAGAILEMLCVTGTHGPNLIFLLGIPIGVSASAAVLIAYLIGTDRRTIFHGRALVTAGALSYSLYLWQTPFSIVAEYHPAQFSVLESAVLTVLAATLSLLLVERPIRRRFGHRAPVRPRRQGPAPASGTMGLKGTSEF